MITKKTLAHIICEQFEPILNRLTELEVKVNMLALNQGMIQFCQCQKSEGHIMIEGMPCCPICECVLEEYFMN
jgi:hypothetical protein